MLSLMRNHASSWIIKFFLGAIVIVFVFWGVGNFRSPNQMEVANVNGESISYEEYKIAYNNYLQQLKQNFGGSLSSDMIKMLQVNKQVIDKLVEHKLIIQQAKKYKLQTSKEEMVKQIEQIQAFKRNEIFDSSLYLKILNNYKISPEKFETDQKNALLSDKLISFIKDNAKVTDDELKYWYDWENAKIVVI